MRTIRTIQPARAPVTAPTPARKPESHAAQVLRAVLARDVRNHALRLADIIGVYPC